ncbi:MAG: dihydrofolate reductase [Actinobacteria bacterium]|nr:dihydrofolate reductase [Actinomycetota bacterium]
MGKVTIDMSMSLDGFVTGPNDGPGQELGEGGMQLHEWIFGLAGWRKRHGLEGGETGPNDDIVEEAFTDVGAVVMGRRMFELGEEPWGDDPPFHAPVFVVTHRAREPLEREGGTTFTFVTDGVESALDQAKKAAGDKNVSIAGGAETAQQLVGAGLVDEIQFHVAPLLLGGGKRLFEELGTQVQLETTRVIDSPGVTHLRFRVVK